MKSSTPGAVKVVSMRFYRPTRSIRLLQTDRTIYSNIRQIVQYTPLDGQAPKTRVTGSQESTKDKYPTPVRCYIPCSLSHNPIQAHFTT